MNNKIFLSDKLLPVLQTDGLMADVIGTKVKSAFTSNETSCWHLIHLKIKIT